MVFALTLIQFAGSLMLQLLGPRMGAVLAGFFGGLVSSTAMTASLAKQSKLDRHKKRTVSETLTFLAATLAMLVEGAVILAFGTQDAHAKILIVLFGPALACTFFIFAHARSPLGNHQKQTDKGQFDLLPIFKLSIFIIAILSASKVLQYWLGKSGLLVLTFIVSLFEIHGSFIANTQLHDSGAFDARMLGNLAAISVAASYLSKWFLIYTLGSSELKAQANKYSIYLFGSLVLSWLVFSWLY